ncbi:MAG: 1-acyl-sn-glycerol-3-phosphate acyltransferase [Phycisphaerales bacterium]|nr:1-acyl-sn-glycerol-3-phosphate acyltransferase [Hyphomonadaceae bacterium]
MILLRSIVFVIWFYATMAVWGLAYMPLVAMGREKYIWHAMRGWGKATLWGLRWICGVRISIEGLEHLPQGAALIASKHQATLDTVLPAQFVTEPVFVVKQELIGMPIFGFYMKYGMIPIDRDAHAKALKDMLRAARIVIAKGRQIVIYPEGTRQDLGAAPDYKPGIAALYKDLGLPVTPIALNTGLVWPPSGIMRRPGHVTIKVLPPIPPGLPRADFMRTLEDMIESESQALLPPDKRHSVAP